jgi:L-asparaginase/Glu-tRNA(Gln) amidotransferase subunit D
MPLLSDLDGLLLVAFPSGTAPTHQEAFRKLLSAARARGLPVMVVTEGAGVTGNEYQAGKALLDEGCLWSGTMTPECAYVKASWLLGQPRGAEILKAWWNVEFADEGVSQGR